MAVIEDDTPLRPCVCVRKEAADSRLAAEEQRGALGWQQGRGNCPPVGCSSSASAWFRSPPWKWQTKTISFLLRFYLTFWPKGLGIRLALEVFSSCCPLSIKAKILIYQVTPKSQRSCRVPAAEGMQGTKIYLAMPLRGWKATASTSKATLRAFFWGESQHGWGAPACITN